MSKLLKFGRLFLVLSFLLAAVGVVGVAAQEPVEPETVTIPAFDTGAVIEAGMGIVGSFFVLILTMAAIRLAPKLISAVRRSLGAAVGR